MVGVKTADLATEMAPFGGVKQSGSRRGLQHGIEGHLELKYVALAGLRGAARRVEGSGPHFLGRKG